MLAEAVFDARLQRDQAELSPLRPQRVGLILASAEMADEFDGAEEEKSRFLGLGMVSLSDMAKAPLPKTTSTPASAPTSTALPVSIWWWMAIW